MEDTHSREILHDAERIGKRIKRAREKKGVSIEELSASLHISEKVLAAIEEGRHVEGIAPVFMRGFIRSYAQHVEAWDEDLEQQMRQDQELQEVPVKPLFQRSPFPKRKNKRVRNVLVFFILGAAGYLIYALFYFSPPSPESVSEMIPADSKHKLNEPDKTSINTETSITETSPDQKETIPEVTTEPEMPVQNPSPAELPEPEAAGKLTDAEPLNGGEEDTDPFPSSKPEAVLEAEGEPTLDEPAEFAAAVEKKLPDVLEDHLPPPVVSSMKLVISATDRTWISIALDGGPYRDVQFEAGESYEWETNNQFLLTLGNSAAVHLMLDGRELEFDRSRSLLTDWGIRTDSRIE